mgnify:CR=1 FL=1
MLNIINSGGYKKWDTLALVRPQNPQTGTRYDYLVPTKAPCRFSRFLIAICGSDEEKSNVKSFEEGAHSAKEWTYKVLSQQYGTSHVQTAFKRNGYQLEWEKQKSLQLRAIGIKKETKPLTERSLQKIESELKRKFATDVDTELKSLKSASYTIVEDRLKTGKQQLVKRPLDVPSGMCSCLEEMSMKLAHKKCDLIAHGKSDFPSENIHDVAKQLYKSAHQEVFTLYHTLKESGATDDYVSRAITAAVEKNEKNGRMLSFGGKHVRALNLDALRNGLKPSEGPQYSVNIVLREFERVYGKRAITAFLRNGYDLKDSSSGYFIQEGGELTEKSYRKIESELQQELEQAVNQKLDDLYETEKTVLTAEGLVEKVSCEPLIPRPIDVQPETCKRLEGISKWLACSKCTQILEGKETFPEGKKGKSLKGNAHEIAMRLYKLSHSEIFDLYRTLKAEGAHDDDACKIIAEKLNVKLDNFGNRSRVTNGFMAENLAQFEYRPNHLFFRRPKPEATEKFLHRYAQALVSANSDAGARLLRQPEVDAIRRSVESQYVELRKVAGSEENLARDLGTLLSSPSSHSAGATELLRSARAAVLQGTLSRMVEQEGIDLVKLGVQQAARRQRRPMQAMTNSLIKQIVARLSNAVASETAFASLVSADEKGKPLQELAAQGKERLKEKMRFDGQYFAKAADRHPEYRFDLVSLERRCINEDVGTSGINLSNVLRGFEPQSEVKPFLEAYLTCLVREHDDVESRRFSKEECEKLQSNAMKLLAQLMQKPKATLGSVAEDMARALAQAKAEGLLNARSLHRLVHIQVA